MPRFNFRLQGHLNLKSKIEDQRKLEYGQAVSELERERALLARLELQRTDTISAFREGINEGIKPQAASNFNSYLNWLKESIRLQAENVTQAEEIVARRRAALAEAMKERKMLETLKEKHYEDFMREENLAEQKTIDEIVSYRHK